MTKRVLVADDEESMRIIVRNSLKRQGYEVDCAEDGKEAAKLLDQTRYDVALLDIRMPEMDGFKLLERIQKKGDGPPVIMMTAMDTMKNAIDAMKKGAFDYLAKPFDIDELEILVQKAVKERDLQTEVEQLRQEVRESQTGTHTLVGQSRVIRELYKMIGKLATRDVTVLIQGESGTGKELFARAIHYESDRAMHPFVAVNVAAIPKDLLESELFGHTRGAYTGASDDRVGYFQRANRGTIFLDEIGEMPLNLQSKLLRVLQEREFQRLGSSETMPMNARVIAATNQNLAKMVQQKEFREDLYYRLNVVPIEIPPLRARKEDLTLLTHYFVQKFSEELGSTPKQISVDAMKALKTYAWPGNVRELENIIKRAIVLSPGPTIGAEVVEPFLGDSLGHVDTDEIALEDIVRKKLATLLSKWDGYEVEDLYDAVIKRVEKPLIELVLEKTQGNQIKAAKMLGINRNTLHKRIQELKITIPSS